MSDWQVTATTIRCDAVDEDVTILVYGDWSLRCTGLDKYAESRDAALKLLKKSLQQRRTLECEGIGCDRVTDYKRTLLTEEAAKSD